MNNSGDNQLKKVHDAYVVEFLRYNPTVLHPGRAGLIPRLRTLTALCVITGGSAEAEGRYCRHAEVLRKCRSEYSSANRRIDREVALAQIRFSFISIK
jgi:hypothetical protein